MARALWKGSISFGLVQIPVGLYTAEQRDELSLSLLDKHDLAPVGYERVNRRTGAKVDWKNIVKGYQYRKGKYVVVTEEDIRNANVRATQTIDILAFVDQSDISTLYYDTPYYLAPTKQGGKAYAILRDTLEDAGKVGIAKVVIRTRQHLAALLVEDDRLILQLLRFAHELRSADELEVPEDGAKAAKATPRELEMAKQLVASMADKWKPEQYRDEYRDDLLARIKRKATHGDIEDIPTSETTPKRTGAKVIDLADLLRQSVESQHGGGGHAKKQAASRRSTAGSHLKQVVGNHRPKGVPHRTHPTRKAPARKTA
ncbi:MAG TPA: Ku protein [Polyangiaceae bacterium]|nr:Ku protein [Polyangiaceae bacterium]